MPFMKFTRCAAVAAVFLVGSACLGLDQEFNPILPPADTVSFVSVASGDSHACAITDVAEAYCWGANAAGQLGTGNQEYQYSPTLVLGGVLEFDSVAAGGSLSCAITIQNAAYCWGANTDGQLGIGVLSYSIIAEPNKVVGDLEFKAIGAGGRHACGLSTDSQVFCWGYTEDGRLGNGLSGATGWPRPDSVHGGHRFRLMEVGAAHNCAVTMDGDAYCWGSNSSGELGSGNTTNSAEPVLVTGGYKYTAISAGHEHTCAVALDGVAYCWGAGTSGQLGTLSTANVAEPVAVSGGLGFASISAGAGYTCGITDTGDAYCWGHNDAGQLGDGTTTDRLGPAPVVGGLRFETVSAGTGVFGTATCGFATDGVVYCWGDGSLGQVGHESASRATVPTRVSGQR